MHNKIIKKIIWIISIMIFFLSFFFSSFYDAWYNNSNSIIIINIELTKSFLNLNWILFDILRNRKRERDSKWNRNRNRNINLTSNEKNFEYSDKISIMLIKIQQNDVFVLLKDGSTNL